MLNQRLEANIRKRYQPNCPHVNPSPYLFAQRHGFAGLCSAAKLLNQAADTASPSWVFPKKDWDGRPFPVGIPSKVFG